MSRIVLALGGNALGSTPEEQKQAVKATARSIVDLVAEGHQVLLSHGNGPQVGMIHLALDAAARSEVGTPAMPFPECGAMSQGYIGYHLQNALDNEMRARKLDRPVVTLVTQVLVDAEDPAFQHPTKPVGAFYTKEEAQAQEADGVVFREDAGRGYRRVVASPKPVDIIEKQAIQRLYEADCLVVAAGGGGIPVVQTPEGLQGVSAVIDKDFTTEKLAELVDAEILVILTAVEQVAIRFGTPEQEWLDHMTVEEAQRHLANKEFAEGSMKPKVEAALRFAQSKAGRCALITSLEKAADGLAGKTGTRIQQ